MKPSVLAVIPARANSKRIPGKNTKIFCGKPLIYWTIESAIASKNITDIIVTTDDIEILNLQTQYATLKFVKRPDSLALDSTPGVDPVLHIMREMPKAYDYTMLLQPTSPLRTYVHIDAAFDKIKAGVKKQIVSVKRMSDNPNHIVFTSDNRVCFMKDKFNNTDFIKDLKVLNGAIYISEWNTLLEEKTFIGKSVDFFEMPVAESVDIDVAEDWALAEVYFNMREN
jgi:CMP-N,N'-diacetyllegionaminic acid synthase